MKTPRKQAAPLHALQGLLGGPGLPVQAQSPGGAAAEQDNGERSALGVVAGGTVNRAVGKTVSNLHTLTLPPKGAKVAREWRNNRFSCRAPRRFVDWTDLTKREMFGRLHEHLNRLADEIEAAMKTNASS
jgi:hypothetical protein